MSLFRSCRSLVLLTGLLLVLFSAPAFAATSGQDVSSDDDTYTRSDQLGAVGGTPYANDLKVGNYSGGLYEQRAVVHFDLTQFTGLGAGSTVSSAILKFTFWNNSALNGDMANKLRIYRVTSPWVGPGCSWDRASSGPTVLWTTVGGDFTPALGSGITPVAAVAPASNAEFTYDVTAIVNGWINGGLTNYGFIMISDLDGTAGDYYRINEGPDAAGGPAANLTPRLNVTYTSTTATTINASADVGLRSTLNNIGADPILWLVGSAVSANTESILVRFPLASIPNNTQIALLRLKSANGGQAGTDVATAYKVTQPAWVEGSGTRAAQNNTGARWDIYDATTTNFWTTNGGDFDATRAFVSPSTTMGGNDVDIVFDIDISALVVEAQAAAAANVDILVKPGANCDWRIGSKEYAGGTPAAPRTPQLIVTSSASPLPAITVPTPTTTTVGASKTFTWTYTGPMATFDLYLIDSALTAKKINGAPVAGAAGAGTFTWTVDLTGLTGAPGTYTLKVIDPTKLFQKTSAGFTINPAVAPLSISTTSPITAGQNGTVYPGVTFAAAGGSGGYTWSATGVPTGLTLSAGGVLSGTPAVATPGAFVMVVTVTDSSLATVNKNISITISAAPGALALAFVSIPNPVTGVPYTFTATATGGTPPYNTWTATGLPAGLTMNPGTGVISGTPTGAVGSASTVTISVSDSAGPPAATVSSLPLTVTIVAAAAGKKKGGCEVGSTSSDWMAFLLILGFAGMSVAATRFTCKATIV